MVSSIYSWQRQIRQTPDMTRPSEKALADLARRQATPDTRDNTGRLLGDPPPGRSALDRKRAAEERAWAIQMEQEHADD